MEHYGFVDTLETFIVTADFLDVNKNSDTNNQDKGVISTLRN